MPSKITIIQGHPDSSRRHLCHALADAYADAAGDAGHSISRAEIAGIKFPMLRTQEEFNSARRQPLSSLRSMLSWLPTILSWSCRCGSAPCRHWLRPFLSS